jgi:membrane-bound lytic murein transglycosylase D
MKDSIYNYKDSLYFNLKPLVAETKSVKEIPIQYTPGKGYTPVDYTIKSGDNLGYITDWFDTQISEVRYWNGIRGNTIRAGQKLVIYVPDSKKTYYSSVDKLSFQQKQAREGKFISSKAKVLPIEEKLKTGEYTLYTVRSGDNPWQIAKKYPGVSDQDILRWNGISPRDLKPGQKLKIKKISK